MVKDWFLEPPDDEAPCAICDKWCGGEDGCECPECPVCGAIGRVECFDEHGLTVPGITKADVEARWAAWDEEARAEMDGMYETWLESEEYRKTLRGS